MELFIETPRIGIRLPRAMEEKQMEILLACAVFLSQRRTNIGLCFVLQLFLKTTSLLLGVNGYVGR